VTNKHQWIFAAAIALVASVFFGPSAGQARQTAPVLEVRDVGLKTPESVIHDAEADVYLVSNVNGGPSAKDGNGFISRITPEGQVVELEWIAGGRNGVILHGPKGLAIHGDLLFVADVDCVRAFNRTSGAAVWTTCPSGATFLNDLAVGADGNLFVSDSGLRIDEAGVTPTGTDTIYRITGSGKYEVMVHGDQLQRPNGLWITDDGLIVVPFGSGEIARYDAAGKRSVLATAPAGGLDGVVGLPGGDLLVTSWDAQSLFRVTATGEVSTFATGVPSPADLGLDAKRGRVIVPIFNEDRLVAFSVK
jgi:SMP-30/Gluconolactonase/LRE-like region